MNGNSAFEIVHLDLNRLIALRAQEHYQELKRKLDKKKALIRDRSEYKNVESFPDGSFERLQSNEIWERVLSHLHHPSDRTSAYFTCLLFQENYDLEEKRRLGLFPEVLKTLREREYIYFHQFRSKPEKANVLNLREALNGDPPWKTAVDQQFFEHVFFDSQWYCSDTWFMDMPRRCYFETEEDIESALSSLSVPDGPCDRDSISTIRAIHVNRRNAMDPVTFYGKLYEFLDLYGASVWVLKYWGGKMSDGNNYEYLWNIMSRIPNLKALCLVLDEENEEIGNDVVRQKIDVYPFPKNKNLLFFELKTSPLEKNVPVVTEVLRKNVNLKSLSFIRRGVQPHQLPEEVIIAMANLKVECYSLQTSARYLTDEGLEELGRFHTSWPLKVLRLKWSSAGDPVINSSDLAPHLNLFKFLEQLDLEFYVTKNGVDVLHLPNLKILNLMRVRGDSISLDDLINLKSLEKLGIGRLFGEFFRQEDANEIIKFRGYLEKLEESNLWKIFPFLREVKVKEPRLTYRKRGKCFSRF